MPTPQTCTDIVAPEDGHFFHTWVSEGVQQRRSCRAVAAELAQPSHMATLLQWRQGRRPRGACTCRAAHVLHMAHLQVSGNADPTELRLRLEAHQRMLARWEGKVARQLEKIVTLQRGGRGGSAASVLATPLMGQASAQSGGLCIDAGQRQWCGRPLPPQEGCAVMLVLP